MANYRFRTGEHGELVLQVLATKPDPYQNQHWGYGSKAEWRDATVSDIPVADPFGLSNPVRLISQGPLE